MGRVPNRWENVGRQPAGIAAFTGWPFRVPANVGTHDARLAARKHRAVRRPAARMGRRGRHRQTLAPARAPRMSAAAALAAVVPRRGRACGVWQGRLGGSPGAGFSKRDGRLPMQAFRRTGRRSGQKRGPVTRAGAAAFPQVSRIAWIAAAAAQRQGRMDRRADARSLRGDGFAGATSRGTAGRRTDQLGNSCRHSAAQSKGSRRPGGTVGK